MNRSKLIATLFAGLALQGCAAVDSGTRVDASLYDPAARFALTERLRIQIVARTRGEPDDRYWNELRPRLRRQVEGTGLPKADVDLLLAEVDQSRRPAR